MATKHTKRILCGLIMAAVLLASAALAEPDSNAPCPKGNRPCMGAKLQEKIGLTDEQAAQMEQLRTAHWEQMKNIHQLKQEKRESLQEAVESGADEEAIRAAAAELGAVLGDAAVLRAAHVAEVKKILTAEQAEKWQELKQNRCKWRNKMGGPGMWGKGEGKCCKAGWKEDKSRYPMAAEGPKGLWGQRGHRGPRGRRGRWGPPDPEKIIELKDTDGDGKLTVEEFTTTKWSTPAERFEKADTDGDGFLTAEELKESMQQFMGPKDGP